MVLTLTLCLCGVAFSAHGVTCDNAMPGVKALYWGDLHVHTAFSLDAYAFGAIATPKEAYAFAKGQPLRMADGTTTSLDRPLDFAAVTDHAETFDVMYACTDPLYADNAYCEAIRDGRDSKGKLARHIFNTYLLPLVSDSPPQPAEICAKDGLFDTSEPGTAADSPFLRHQQLGARGQANGIDCGAASASQWRRMQHAANEANEPCAFTALIGYEWTPSPGGRHWHRNVIYRSEQVPNQVFDYIRYPQVGALWQALAAACTAENGCDVLTIPHNINWADGGTFEVERAPEAELAARARYERLAEIHQEKGNSECLPADGNDTSPDCAFERLITNAAKERLTGQENLTEAQIWANARSSYYRTLLGRGLVAYESSGGQRNPLMLGAIGSTDTHFGTAGKVSSEDFFGGISSLWLTDEQRLGAPGYNPGGLVAVWAEENTRASIFDALKARSAYATSGPRIRLRFGVSPADACEQAAPQFTPFMGELLDTAEPPTFIVQAARDRQRLARVDLIKGSLVNGSYQERTMVLAEFAEGRDTLCVAWRDPDHDPATPAFWYARVLEQPTPRWTKHLCQGSGLCAQFPDQDVMVQQRAWSSPIWRLP